MGYKLAPWMIAACIAVFVAYIIHEGEAPARLAPVNRDEEPILFRFVVAFYVLLILVFCYVGVQML